MPHATLSLSGPPTFFTLTPTPPHGAHHFLWPASPPTFFDFLCMLLVQNQNSHPILNSFMPMSPNAKSITSDILYGRAMHAILVLFRSFLISYLISVLWYSKPSFVLCQNSPLHTRAKKLLWACGFCTTISGEGALGKTTVINQSSQRTFDYIWRPFWWW